jgi:hypothetical protein
MMLQKREQKKQRQQQLQVKLSTIFKQKISDIPQAYGSLYTEEGKYCALAAIVKYFGYDVAAEKMKDADIIYYSESIPVNIMERIESFAMYNSITDYPKCCTKSKGYHYSLMCLLIHLNDHHQMTFTEIGNLLQSKGL